MNKYSGVLLPIFSLPSKYGIGTFGESAKKFVDFLYASKQSYWQILPLNHTGFGDSPYSCFSTYAGNPYFIDFDLLKEMGLLNKEDYISINWNNQKIDYGFLYENKHKVLRIAVSNFKDNEDYYSFLNENDWLDNYALFMSIKNKFNGCDWLNWPNKYRKKDVDTLNKIKNERAEDIRYYKVIQYLFYKQWKDLKQYANSLNIKIIGDIPFYVAMDSADAWNNPELFEISSKFMPKYVAGVAPDYFSASGQLWGNPLYKWNRMKKDSYAWWISRIRHQKKLYDVIRIDHFRGFDSYYSIPYGNKDGQIGEWKKGPGYKFFKVLNENEPDLDIIAEDLGLITDSVKRLLKKTRYPGMKVLEFAFDSNDDNPYLPHNVKRNSVMYCGTHDNDTIVGWLSKQSDHMIRRIMDYMHIKDTKEFNYKLISLMMKSKSYLSIIQAQDLLGLGSEGRINEPGTSEGNWSYISKTSDFNDKLAIRLAKLTKKYKRIPIENQ